MRLIVFVLELLVVALLFVGVRNHTRITRMERVMTQNVPAKERNAVGDFFRARKVSGDHRGW